MIEFNDTQHSFYMNQMRGKSFSKKSKHVTFQKIIGLGLKFIMMMWMNEMEETQGLNLSNLQYFEVQNPNEATDFLNFF